MFLSRWFTDGPIDFEKRCRNRIVTGAVMAAFGLLTMALSLAGERMPVMYLEPGYHDFIVSFYRGTGMGLAAAGLVVAVRNLRYLRNPELKRRREVYETDERNRLLGLRCWAYTGYTALIALYIAILVSGFISMTVLKTLLAVAAAYVAVLLAFKWILQKAM